MANKKNIRKWIKALRSGKYKQTTGQCFRKKADPIEGPAGYCCLGVANAVCRIDTGRHDTSDNVVLSDATVKWLGLDRHHPLLNITPTERYSAAHLNDAKHLNFNQIADAIERTYLKEN